MDDQLPLLSEDLDKAISHKMRRILYQLDFRMRNHTKYRTLSKREIEVIELIVKGYSNPQIAKKLFISRFTVEQHRKNIHKKLKTESLCQLIQFALAFDLI